MKDPVVGGAANLRLRQAIALVIDKQAIIDKFYNGARKIATGWTPPGIPGYTASLNQFPKQDLAKAKSLCGRVGAGVRQEGGRSPAHAGRISAREPGAKTTPAHRAGHGHLGTEDPG